MATIKIEWTDYSYNPITGCKHGCEYCYACKMARFRKTPDAKAFLPEYHPDKLDDINGILKGVIFAGSNADFFGEWVPKEWLDAVVEKARSYCAVNGHEARLMFLTKNPARYSEILPAITTCCENIWLGTTLDKGYTSNGWDTKDGGKTVHHDTPSVEARIFAIDELDYPRKWLSIEPYKPEQYPYYTNALGGIDVQWIVIGTMTNPDQKLTSDDLNNIQHLVDMFESHAIPVFVKNNIIKQAVARGGHAADYPRHFPFPVGVALATKSPLWHPKATKPRKPKDAHPAAKHVSLDNWTGGTKP